MSGQFNIVSRLFLSFGIYWLLFCWLTQYKKTRGSLGMQSVNLIDYAVIGLYALLMALVGLYVMRFNRSAAEYFRGGSRVQSRWILS